MGDTGGEAALDRAESLLVILGGMFLAEAVWLLLFARFIEAGIFTASHLRLHIQCWHP